MRGEFLLQSFPVDAAALCLRGQTGKNHVLQNREASDNIVVKRILRHHAKSQRNPFFGVGGGNVVRAERYGAATDGTNAKDAFGKLALSITGNTGNPNNPAAFQFEIHITKDFLVVIVQNADVLQTKRWKAWEGNVLPCGFDVHSGNVFAEHKTDDFLPVKSFRPCDAGSNFSGTQNCNLICDRYDFVELMGDKNDRVSFVFEADQHIKETADLVRSQNRGRLVKNHHAGTFVDEDLDDFNMLALPQIQLPDFLIRIDAEMILL